MKTVNQAIYNLIDNQIRNKIDYRHNQKMYDTQMGIYNQIIRTLNSMINNIKLKK